MIERLAAAVIGCVLLVGPSLAQAPSLVWDVRARIANDDFDSAERLIIDYRRRLGATPEALEALSWLGRGALAARRFDAAERYARNAYDLSVAQLKGRRLDLEPQLPIALGAAIEVLGQVAAARNARTEAVAFLEREWATYRGTSIAARIQKNIHLISLVGTRAPALDLSESLGPKPPSLDGLRGRVVLMFFWAHWCGDCKLQGPVLERMQARYGPRGLTVIAPTQRYGYVAAGRDAGPLEERHYIDSVREGHFPGLANVPVPLAAANHERYGVSTTPTLVVIDRGGSVRFYHPGRITEAALDAVLRPLL